MTSISSRIKTMTGLTAPSGECSVPAAIPNPNPSDLPFLELVWIGFTGILSKLLGLFDPSSVKTSFGVPTTCLFAVAGMASGTDGVLCIPCLLGEALTSPKSSTKLLPPCPSGGEREGESAAPSSYGCVWDCCEETVFERL